MLFRGVAQYIWPDSLALQVLALPNLTPVVPCVSLGPVRAVIMLTRSSTVVPCSQVPAWLAGAAVDMLRAVSGRAGGQPGGSHPLQARRRPPVLRHQPAAPAGTPELRQFVIACQLTWRIQHSL